MKTQRIYGILSKKWDDFRKKPYPYGKSRLRTEAIVKPVGKSRNNAVQPDYPILFVKLEDMQETIEINYKKTDPKDMNWWHILKIDTRLNIGYIIN